MFFSGARGQVLESHSTRATTDFQTIETAVFNPLAAGGAPRGAYRSGLIAQPPSVKISDSQRRPESAPRFDFADPQVNFYVSQFDWRDSYSLKSWAQALEKDSSKAATWGLLVLATSADDWRVREAAVMGLARRKFYILGYKAGVDGMKVHVLARHSSWKARHSLALALRFLQGRDVYLTLLLLSFDADYKVRQAAKKSLHQMSDAERQLDSDFQFSNIDVDFRMDFARTLGYLSGASSQNLLEILLEDSDPEVREEARRSLQLRNN